MTEATNGEAKLNEITDGYVEIDDLKIYYKKSGSGPHNVLFTSGTLGTSDDFDIQLTQWDASKYSMLAWDVPGYGKSRPPNRVQEPGRAKKDGALALKLMEHFKMLPFSAVGWSEGGRMSLHMAHQGKTNVKKVVIYATGCVVTEQGAHIFENTRNTSRWPEEKAKKFVDIYGKDYFQDQWGQIVDLVSEHRNQMGGRFPSSFVLSAIKCPLLAMEGSADNLSNVTPIVEGVKGAVYLNKPHGAHDLQISSYKWFNRVVPKFLDE